MTKILLVEDDEKLGSEIRASLVAAEFDVTWFQDGAIAFNANPDDFQLIILDLMLPGKHGFDILKKYRSGSDVPVLILTARTDTMDKVRGFKLGGDDYLTKPFWPEELVARVEARLRRPALSTSNAYNVGPIEVDLDARLVSVSGEAIELTRVEFEILAALCRRPGNSLTRRQLVEIALDEEREGTERTLDVHVSRLRKKLGESGTIVKTVRGVGYKVQAPE